MSDQSQFTGFNDSEQQKTINIVTKKGRNTGQFGRIYGGAGADENANLRYSTGAALNQFSAKRKITLLLLSNNINQQNFSAADLSGVTQNNQQGGRGGQGGGRQGGNSILISAPQINGQKK
jgi:hypothetical protein